LKKDRYLESIKAHILTLPSYRRFPEDDEFTQHLMVRDLYNFRSRSYFFRRLENHGRKEKVSIDEYTIEHIMPQNENLSIEWRTALGPDWEQVQQTWLHRLGNLTLTGYNSEYSDHSFAQKRDMEGGFRESPLRLNQGLGRLDTWSGEEMAVRGRRLAELATEVWAAPDLATDVLRAYRPAAQRTATYSLADHAHLSAGAAMRPVFDVLRREILALDPGITEEVLKLYIAYKAETNFVDIVPQAQRLRLTLNMPFNEISDPRGVCRDVTDLGRWGNGDVEIGLDSIDDVPYVIGLIRQSLERQLGNEAVA
jgi:predicted transport protein